MKRINYLFFLMAALAFAVACKNVNFKKTKSGLTYKLYPSKGKDSLIKEGNVVKFNYTFKYNDSMMERMNSYGKMPFFLPVQMQNVPSYDFQELLPLMKKGDSAVIVMVADSVLGNPARQSLFPPHAKKGDRLTMTMKIIDVFTVDSIARADYNKEMEKDMPRQIKEREEEMAKMQKEQEEQRLKEEEELVKSGEVAKELQEMEAYLAAKKINAQKTGKGTYVLIKEQGTGPAAANDKYVNVKYTGKLLATDSVFQSNSYSFQLGKGSAIRGWHEGLLLFKQGGKGTLYIPGFLAYGRNPPPSTPFKPFEPLVFDVEVLQVSDSAINRPVMQ